MNKKTVSLTVLCAGLLACLPEEGQSATTNTAPKMPSDAIPRLMDEGTNRSQVMEIASYLTDVIGPRLTGSTGLRRADEWTRDHMAEWGLTNAHLEAWGPFGYGWTLKRFTAQVTEPQCIPLIAVPRAWTPGLEKPLAGEVVYVGDITHRADLEKLKGQLKGAMVLSSPPWDMKGNFEPVSVRYNETNLLRLANASAGGGGGMPARRGPPPSAANARTNPVVRPAVSPKASEEPPPAVARRADPSPDTVSPEAKFAFLAQEEVALVIGPSRQGEAGVVQVMQAAVPGSYSTNRNRFSSFGRGSPWAPNAPKIPAQITVSTEQYNRLARMMRLGVKPRLEVDLQVQFQTNDVMVANSTAELPGTDLKDQIVMLGAHLDSWHAGSGAVDNAIGAAICMEAVRLIKAAGLQPRRTIRVGLWGGEEQGLLGSRAYVREHFGFYTNETVTNVTVQTVTNPASSTVEFKPARVQTNSVATTTNTTTSTRRKFVPGPEFERLSAYFNVDNGAGRFRGIYLQGNEALRPLFRRWLEPFRDLGAETISAGNTGGTDHLSFDDIGLPGFQFIQDGLDYFTRSWHTNMDVYERILPDDVRQAAIIMAAFVYNTAMMDERLPRK